MPVWKCIMNKKNNASNKKNQKLLQVLKVLYFLQCFFSCLRHPPIPLFLLFIWLLVTPLTQWGYMIVIKITRATGLLPLKAWTIIPYTEEVKAWLTIWFRGHLSYISVLATTGLPPSIYKQMSSNHNNYSKKATFGYASCNLTGVTKRIIFLCFLLPLFDPSFLVHTFEPFIFVVFLLSTIQPSSSFLLLSSHDIFCKLWHIHGLWELILFPLLALSADLLNRHNEANTFSIYDHTGLQFFDNNVPVSLQKFRDQTGRKMFLHRSRWILSY